VFNLKGGSSSTDLRVLYDALMPMLYRVALRIVHSPETAEDVVHEAFAKLVEKSMVFPSADDAKYWLIRVVKNAAINQAKRKTRENRAYERWWKDESIQPSASSGLPRSPDSEGVFNGSSESADVQILRDEAAGELRLALDRLPERLRMVLILKEYGGLSYREIGKVLGITEGNVKVRAFRAREQLLVLLGGKV
jgi:RNA polymerase sigma-70 factor (ECF subfamily)